MVKKKTKTKAVATPRARVKKTTPAPKPVEKPKEKESQKELYIYRVGKRKTAIARVRLYTKGDGRFQVNGKEFKVYFPTLELQERALSALKIVGQTDKLSLSVIVRGGGSVSQADAVRHGLSRCLVQLNANFRKPLKKAGCLTRDARKKERKKPGLKRARKAPQWQKR